ncbi:hypothetical protein PHSY_001738 [Pseudozyma hubeiensis SY62]|uniref:Uncharacterized protein n=1 Tax=Pseudozyma hubeiensis (strain SY62) TaxID=1305764 RepID=R9NZL3_PSEHS|nr:hypothetical protein PHSY_001738 [Pseudozyma hubeiensis SY62]GAC94167.1 hypothetical protein PHSY_001738 [Pseudozyma hubeiensis SY62]
MPKIPNPDDGAGAGAGSRQQWCEKEEERHPLDGFKTSCDFHPEPIMCGKGIIVTIASQWRTWRPNQSFAERTGSSFHKISFNMNGWWLSLYYCL